MKLAKIINDVSISPIGIIISVSSIEFDRWYFETKMTRAHTKQVPAIIKDKFELDILRL